MSARLELALERLGSADWRRFEKFASEFLVEEFPDLRTTASPSGDGGRDAELFTFSGDVTHALQYSVTPKWAAKIRDTVDTLKKSFPDVFLLTYVTNIEIGALADELRKEIRRDHQVIVDLRDRGYFLARENKSKLTKAASEDLACDVVDPLLVSRGLVNTTQSVLTSDETRAAHLFLSLQLRDDSQQKGLTKTAFEALVRSVLSSSNSENHIKRTDIISRVQALLPGDNPQRVQQLIESTLSRLTKKAFRYYTKEDEYCLTHTEVVLVSEHLASHHLHECALLAEVRSIVIKTSEITDDQKQIDAVTGRVRHVLEQCLYSRAEAFAAAVTDGNMTGSILDNLHVVISQDYRLHAPIKNSCDADPALIRRIATEVFSSSGEAVQRYMNYLSEAYTVMAFLRSTPDVQSALQKIFSFGEVWLDTTVLLPLLGEELLPKDKGKFQQMMHLASEAGLSFYVTHGVLEELQSHLRRAEACARIPASDWEGDLPFMYQVFVQCGHNDNDFPAWIENFMGSNRPIDDLVAFLKDRFAIDTLDLEEELAKAPSALREAVDQIWYDTHKNRREKAGVLIDPHTIIRLAKHDTESYVGVIQRRERDGNSPLGYSAWWLTFDRAATRIKDELSNRHGVVIAKSPVMSADFLFQYLSLGPVRSKLPKDSMQQLPILIEPQLMAYLSKDLLDEARKIRLGMVGTSERVIERRVRDRMDEERGRRGPLAEKGMQTFIEELDLYTQ